jgi:hypothetical protein
LDALFETLAREQQLPEVSALPAAVQDRTPPPVLASDAARPEHSGSEATGTRTFLGRFSVALAAVVLGPLAFLGVNRASRKARFAAVLNRAK